LPIAPRCVKASRKCFNTPALDSSGLKPLAPVSFSGAMLAPYAKFQPPPGLGLGLGLGLG